MIKCFFFCLFLISSCACQAQSKETLQKYLIDNLSYQHIKYKVGAEESQVNIYKVEIKDCTMSYPLYIKKGDKTERFTVRILLSGTDEIKMLKTKEGYCAIKFATKGKSILREYGNGTLIHQKTQQLPLNKWDAKALEYIKKLKVICNK